MPFYRVSGGSGSGSNVYFAKNSPQKIEEETQKVEGSLGGSANAQVKNDLVSNLEELNTLADSGVLSEEAFNKAKKKLLGK